MSDKLLGRINMATDNIEEEEAFSEGFHGLPSEKERATMSVLRLAELLSTQEKDSVAHIVLEHELNLKISKIQAKATLNAGWLGAGATIVAVLIALALGYYTGSSQTKESNESKREKTSTDPAINANTTRPEAVPPILVPQVVPPKPIEVKPVNKNSKRANPAMQSHSPSIAVPDTPPVFVQPPRPSP